MPFFCPWWPWPLIFDLDLQFHPSEGPNTLSVWIRCKSVQLFPRYFVHKQKTQTDGAKNRTFRMMSGYTKCQCKNSILQYSTLLNTYLCYYIELTPCYWHNYKVSISMHAKVSVSYFYQHLIQENNVWLSCSKTVYSWYYVWNYDEIMFSKSGRGIPK